jgi:hypothetical protein
MMQHVAGAGRGVRASMRPTRSRRDQRSELSLSQPARVSNDRMVPPEKQIREPFERTKKTVRNRVG